VADVYLRSGAPDPDDPILRQEGVDVGGPIILAKSGRGIASGVGSGVVNVAIVKSGTGVLDTVGSGSVVVDYVEPAPPPVVYPTRDLGAGGYVYVRKYPPKPKPKEKKRPRYVFEKSGKATLGTRGYGVVEIEYAGALTDELLVLLLLT
jgi:hypothetical protein